VVLLDRHDGDRGSLFLNQEEFAHLKECWRRNGLPSDLYYARSLERTVREPQQGSAGVFIVSRRYSPLQWKHRSEDAEAIEVPSEADRKRAFLEACEAFEATLSIRMLQLEEPDRERDWRSIDRLKSLRDQVLDVIKASDDSKTNQ
jgi:hypothetical protein